MARFTFSSARELAHWSLTLWQAYQLHTLKQGGVPDPAFKQQGSSFFNRTDGTGVFLALLMHLDVMDEEGENKADQRRQNILTLLDSITSNQKEVLINVVVDYQLPARFESVTKEGIRFSEELNAQIVQELQVPMPLANVLVISSRRVTSVCRCLFGLLTWKQSRQSSG